MIAGMVNVPVADRLYDEHLAELKRKGWIDLAKNLRWARCVGSRTGRREGQRDAR